MKNRYLWIVIVFALQLGVPAWMIFRYSAVENEGREWKFKVVPYDPHDLFRGQYLRLQFEIRNTSTKNRHFKDGDICYIGLKPDSAGYASIREISKTALSYPDYLQVNITSSYPQNETTTELTFELPFEQYFISESAAMNADTTLRNYVRNGNADVYAAVKILNGKAVMREVYMGDKPLSYLRRR